ncbi:MAG TPA: hypothetical protein VED66_11815, partial [Candidatus Sulfotelmatobacter sp.]|nr:hypothetical protein [Candidatus Sulfotelmatobacter sp.]
MLYLCDPGTNPIVGRNVTIRRDTGHALLCPLFLVRTTAGMESHYLVSARQQRGQAEERQS